MAINHNAGQRGAIICVANIDTLWVNGTIMQTGGACKCDFDRGIKTIQDIIGLH